MSEIINKPAQQLEVLPKQSQKPLISICSPIVFEKTMSVYTGDLHMETIIAQNKFITKAFPQLKDEFFEILNYRIREKKFTDQRLIDAVSHVIDTCVYPTPTVANFLSYDRCIELLTHADLVDILGDDRYVFDRYDAVRIPGVDKPRYARREDVIEYKLEKINK